MRLLTIVLTLCLGRCYALEGLVDLLVCLIATHLADSVLEHGVLLEEVVDGNLVLGVVVHRALEEEAQETLDAVTACACCEVAQEHEVKT